MTAFVFIQLLCRSIAKNVENKKPHTHTARLQPTVSGKRPGGGNLWVVRLSGAMGEQGASLVPLSGGPSSLYPYGFSQGILVQRIPRHVRKKTFLDLAGRLSRKSPRHDVQRVTGGDPGESWPASCQAAERRANRFVKVTW